MQGRAREGTTSPLVYTSHLRHPLWCAPLRSTIVATPCSLVFPLYWPSSLNTLLHYPLRKKTRHFACICRKWVYICTKFHFKPEFMSTFKSSSDHQFCWSLRSLTAVVCFVICLVMALCSCGATTKAVIKAGDSATSTSITITTNNPTSMQVNPSIEANIQTNPKN